jgi:alkylated DNA repair protein alkB homolog 1
MYAPPGADDRPQTAFRAAEKKYKLTLTEQFRTGANGRRRGGRFEAAPVDLSEVLDVSARDALPQGVTCVSGDANATSKVYAFDGHPGFYYVSRALDDEEQRLWVRKSVRELCEPPARTNYGAELGDLPPGLWDAARDDLMLIPSGEGQRVWGTPTRVVKRGDADEKFFAKRMLSKLRWCTVGAPFNWTSRIYEPNVPRRAIGDDLVQLTRRIASLPPEPSWTFEAQAGLLNFYQPGDTLNAHVDDAERNLDRPIISISLGCCGIFLLGHENRDAPPTAMMIRSGDAVILGGESRKCYHGVPRVFEADDGHFALPNALHADAWDADDAGMAQYIAHTRINISIRDID